MHIEFNEHGEPILVNAIQLEPDKFEYDLGVVEMNFKFKSKKYYSCKKNLSLAYTFWGHHEIINQHLPKFLQRNQLQLWNIEY